MVAPYTGHELRFRFPDDGGNFAEAAIRCVGAGKCRHLFEMLECLRSRRVVG
ncbi:hypothetical protein ACWC09_40305 [Streptomyces sp. NPDC001617]